MEGGVRTNMAMVMSIKRKKNKQTKSRRKRIVKTRWKKTSLSSFWRTGLSLVVTMVNK